ncbi:MAG: TonB family protein [Terriglobia bacterium]
MICRAGLTFVLNSLWQVSVIALAALLAGRLIRRAPVRRAHLLWLCALALSILLPLWSVKTAWEPLQASGLQSVSAPSIGAPLDSTGAARESSARLLQAAARVRGDSAWMRLLHNGTHSVPLPLFWIYLFAAGYGLSLAAGSIRLARCLNQTRNIRRRARRRELPERISALLNRCSTALGIQTPAVMFSSAARGPLTLGALQPVIIFPNHLLDCGSDEDLMAAFAHEMAHIRRRDYLVNLVCEIAGLLVAFHPAALFIKRRIDGTREMACDEAAAGIFADAPAYAHSLVRIARVISAGRGARGYSLGVFDSEILEERVMRLLEKNHHFSRRATGASLFAVSALLAFTALGASAFSLNSGVRGQSAASASVTRSQQSPLRGTVYDPSGARVPGAAVVLANEKTGEKWNRISGDTGEFSFDHLAPGRYSLSIQKQGFARYTMMFFRTPQYPLNVVLQVGGVLESVIITAKAPVHPPTAKEPVHPRTTRATAKEPTRIRVGGLVEATKLVKLVRPAYPERAREQGIQGTVTLEAVISKEGVPLDLKIVQSPSPALATAARDAVQQWRYQPTLLNGEPIEVVTTISLMFRLVR